MKESSESPENHLSAAFCSEKPFDPGRPFNLPAFVAVQEPWLEPRPCTKSLFLVVGKDKIDASRKASLERLRIIEVGIISVSDRQ